MYKLLTLAAEMSGHILLQHQREKYDNMKIAMKFLSIANIHFSSPQAFSEGCAAGGKIFPLMAENAEIEPKVKRLSEGGEAEANMIPVEFESLQLDDVKFNYPARPTLQVCGDKRF